jgi:hypothetical protein
VYLQNKNANQYFTENVLEYTTLFVYITRGIITLLCGNLNNI